MIDLAALKSRIPLAGTIAEYVRLERRGRTLWGCCPFHHEKTASFAVHENYYYCHSCHVKGDVIDFTAAINRVSKGRAIRLLAERAGMETGTAPARRESAYKRNLAAQAGFWWARRRGCAMGDLYAAFDRFMQDGTWASEFAAEIAGARVRVIDSISPELRGRIFLWMRTAADAREFAREAAWDREFEKVWMEISR